MIFLIVSLTPVFAYTYYSIYGSENIDDFVRSGEEFTARVDQPGGAVYVNVSGELNSCECNEGNTTCYCYFGPQYEAGQKTVDIAIQQGEVFISQPPLTYDLDSNAPEVSFNQSLNGNQLTINYTITDTSGSDDVDCSGIDNFKIFVNNYLQHTEVVNSGTANCTIQGSLTFPITPEPVVAVSILAKDEVGNAHEEPADEELTMDAYPPVILGSFEIMQGDVALEKIALNNPQVPIVDVVILVNEENLVQVRGDLSSFNNVPIQNMGYENKLATCVFDTEINLYRCKFRNINLHPESELISLGITAVDAQNNVAVETLEREYEIVNAENDVTHIGPSLERNCDSEGKCFIGKNAVLYTIIAGSADTSFRQMNVPIKISQLSSTYSIANPFTCDDELGDWRCIYTVQVDEGNKGLSKYLYIDHHASDDYGKGLNGLDKSLVVVDMQEPSIAEDSKTLLVNNDIVQDYCLTSEDKLTVKLRASDDLSTELKISATSNLTIDQVHRNDCVRDGGAFNCEVDITNFLSTEEIDKEVEVRVEDLAGNYANYTFLIDTCAIDMELVPTLISRIDIGDGYNPDIDKRVASFKHWKHYIPLEFVPTSNQVGIIDYEITNCEAYDEDLGDDYVYGYDDSWSLLSKNGTFATASVLIGGKDIIADSKDLVCTVAFEGRIGTTYFLKKQYVNFTAPMDFFGLNIAGPDATIDKNIDTLKDDIKGLNKDIKKYQGVETTLGTLCGIGETMATVNAVIQATNLIIYTFAAVVSGGTVTDTFFTNIAAKSNALITKKFWPPGNPLSFFLLGRDPTIVGNTGLLIKNACWIYTCKFYDMQEYTDLFVDKVVLKKDKDYAKLKEKLKAANVAVGATGIQSHAVNFDPTTGIGVDPITSRLGRVPFASGFNPGPGASFAENTAYENPFTDPASGYGFVVKEISLTGQAAADTTTTEEPYVFDRVVASQAVLDTVGQASSSWILNPYKSKDLDALCIPATVFNLKKEREIKCMKIKCLEHSKNTGVGTNYCDELDDFRSCLYLESAAVRISNGWFDLMMKNFPQAATSALMGTTFSYLVQKLCPDFYVNFPPEKYLSESGIQKTLCGVAMTAISVNTIVGGYSSTMSGVSSVFGGDVDLGDNCEDIEFD